MRGLLAAWRGLVIPTHEPTHSKLTPGEANVRVPVRVGAQTAPDPWEQGAGYGRIAARPAQAQIVTFFHDQNAPEAADFQAIIVGPQPLAAYPRGRQAPFSPRANITVPPHVAYGSLFTG